MFRKKLIIPLLLLSLSIVLAGCGEKGKSGIQTRGKQSSTKPKGLEESTYTIVPDNAKKRDIIRLDAGASALSGADIRWTVNGKTAGNKMGVTFSSAELQKGDVIRALIMKNGKEYRSNEIIIRNTPPWITRAAITPRVPRKDSILGTDITTEDIDGDRVSLSYKWFLNDRLSGEGDTLEAEFHRDDRVKVKITPFDGEDYGNSVVLKTRIYNSPPKIKRGGAPSYDGTIYTYTIRASDPDGDTLTYTLVKAPKGMKIDEKSGLIRWEVPSGTSGSIPVEVKVSDSHGGGSIYSFEVIIGREEVSGK